MTTELAEQGTQLAVMAEDPRSLVAWAQQAREAFQIAKSLAGTSFVPKTMQGRPDEVCGAILTGLELGLEPMAALRSIHVIDGTPALSANAMRGLLQIRGHRVWVEESSDTRAIVCGQRRQAFNPMGGGQPAPIERSVWTLDKARKAGLANKKNWQTYPAAMLVARATAEICRLVAADVLLGLPYAVEELDGEQPPGMAQAAQETAPKTKARTLKRDPLPAPGPRPASAPQPASAPPYMVDVQLPEEAPPGPMSEVQRGRLMAAYRAHGLNTSDERHAHASRVLGRMVTSSSDLTWRDAGQLLDDLDPPSLEDDEPVQDWPPVTEPGGEQR